jgi:hypothetical protein
VKLCAVFLRDNDEVVETGSCLKKEALMLETSNLFWGRCIDAVEDTGHPRERIHCEYAKNRTFSQKIPVICKYHFLKP